MAIKNCRECGKDVSSKAKKCPHCGAPSLWRVSSGPGFLSWSMLLCTVLVVALYFIGLGNEAPSGPGVDSYRGETAEYQGNSLTDQVSPPATPPAAPVVGAQWSYTQRADPMGKGTTYFAQVLSSNTVSFDSPYGGPQHGTLMLRTHPRYGKDVILAIERGQFLCRSYEDCSILVRFDDQKASTYSAAGAADNSTESIFLRSYPRFAASMLKAKRVRISAEIYQEGSPVFEFDVTGFDETKYKPKQ